MLWMTSLNAWIAERGIRQQEVELIQKARNREFVACHNRPRLRIWHLERERTNIQIPVVLTCGHSSTHLGAHCIKL